MTRRCMLLMQASVRQTGQTNFMRLQVSEHRGVGSEILDTQPKHRRCEFLQESALSGMSSSGSLVVKGSKQTGQLSWTGLIVVVADAAVSGWRSRGRCRRLFLPMSFLRFA